MDYDNRTVSPVEAKRAQWASDMATKHLGLSKGTTGNRETHLSSVESAITRAIESTTEMTAEVRNIADGLYGCQPEPCETDKACCGASGRLGDINVSLGILTGTLGELRAQISRLNGLV